MTNKPLDINPEVAALVSELNEFRPAAVRLAAASFLHGIGHEKELIDYFKGMCKAFNDSPELEELTQEISGNGAKSS